MMQIVSSQFIICFCYFVLLEADDYANSKFSIYYLFLLFCSSSKSVETCLHLFFVILFSIFFFNSYVEECK